MKDYRIMRLHISKENEFGWVLMYPEWYGENCEVKCFRFINLGNLINRIDNPIGDRYTWISHKEASKLFDTRIPAMTLEQAREYLSRNTDA